MKRILMIGACAVALTACSGQETAAPKVETPPATETAEAPAATGMTLAEATVGDWRTDSQKARDVWRNPVETLEFFGIESSDTVVEISPGGGWYTNVLAPYLASGGGKLIAAHYDPAAFPEDRREAIQKRVDDFAAVYAADPDTFGTVEISAFSKMSGPLTEAGTADAVLTFRNVHNWMGGDYTAKAFEDAYAALKPGGIMGVVEHRLPSNAEQDPRGRSGNVHEDFVKAIAISAGFEFAESSEINANPNDTADHPFGVWTLPPRSRTEALNGVGDDEALKAKRMAIGESDRMTLKFRKI